MATISTSGISALQVIKSEHLLRIINALNGVVSNDIIINSTLSNGLNNLASGIGSHAEGYYTSASSNYSHAEGHSTKTLNQSSHAEGYLTETQGFGSHAEGVNSITLNYYSHAEGGYTKTIGVGSHSEGSYTLTGTQKAFLATNFNEGIIYFPTTIGNVTSSFSIGDTLIYDDSELGDDVGQIIDTIGAVGYSGAQTYIVLSGDYTNEYYYTAIVANLSRNPRSWGGNQNYGGNYSHAEGSDTLSYGNSSHAEGYNTTAQGSFSHAEGTTTFAQGEGSHAEGQYTTASGIYSHAEGYQAKSLGNYSHAEGLATIAKGNYQHVQGQYNISSSDQSAFIHGNGTSTSNRSNLIFASGSEVQVTGSLGVSGTLRVGPTSILGAPTYGVNPQAIIAFSSSVFGGGTLDLRNTSTTIEAGEFLGTIQFSGKDDASVAYSMVQIRATPASAPSAGNSGGGNLKFYTSPGGAGSPPTERMSISSAGVTGITGSLNVTVGATITGSLLVTGSNTLIGTKTITGSVFISGSKTVIGSNTITGSLTITGSFVPPVLTSASRAALVTPATGSVVYQSDSITGLYVYKGSSWVNLTSSEISTFLHSAFTPAVSSNYYIGNFPDTSPNTTSTSVRGRILAQHTGQVVSAVIAINIGTNGSGEISVFTIVNQSKSTSSVISSAIVHNADSLATYTLATPLAVTEGDILTVQWTTPAWVTAPINVRQRITMKTLVTN